MWVLPLAEGVAPTTAITQPDVQVAIRPEGEVPAVVIAGGLLLRQHDFLTGGVGPVRVLRHAEARYDGITGGVGVVHKEETRAGVLRMEGQPQQALLAAARP